MSRIIVEPKDNDELKSLETYLEGKGIVFKTEEEYQLQKQHQLMKRFADMLSQAPKTNIYEEEIDSIVEEVRTKRYEANRS